MSFTNIQAAAARTMLRRSLEKVSEDTGININMISRFERGDGNLLERNRAILEKYYTESGIEFLDSDGLRKRKVMTRTYEGQAGFRSLMDQVYETARDQGGHISLFNGPPGLFLKWLGEDWYAMHAKRMKALKDNIDFRIIVKEGEHLFIAHDFAKYRWFPAEKFKERTVYAFGGKVAFLNFEDDLQIVVIEQKDIAESFHILFDIAWENTAVEPN